MPSPELKSDSLNIQLLVDSIPALIHTARPDGYLDYFNRPWLEYLGATLEDVIGWKWTAFVHPEDVAGILATWRASLATGEIFQYETRVRRANGEYRWMFHQKVPLRDEQGNIVKWYGSSLDVDERRTVEERLRRNTQELQRSEFYLAEAQRLTHTGSWVLDMADQSAAHLSDEYYRIFGFDPAQGAPSWEQRLERVHPEDRLKCKNTIEQAIVEKADYQMDFRVVLPYGALKWIHTVGHPVLSPAGELVQFMGCSMDITERKHAEEELQQFVDFVRHIITVLSPNGKITYANRVAREYTGLTLDEYRSVDVLARVIHPDDLQRMRAVRERGLSANNPFEIEARTLTKDGVSRWFLYRYNPLRDERGQITRWYVTGTDIEDRKQVELELRQMLDLAPQLIVVFGPGRERLYANRVALDYLGLSHDEWRQMKPDRGAFLHPDDRALERDYAGRSVSTGAAYELELRVRRSNGSYRWFLCRFNPVRDDKGQVMRWYCSCTDIDDRKQAEERLRQENVALREEIDQASMFEDIVGTSPILQKVLSSISKVAPSNSTVLITGETGTGKELVARAIHKHSQRSSRAFVSVNCAAIPSNLIASELFGHEKGAFTGAAQQRLGRFELASGGTIFLDEVGELPAETQIALLRVLQEREFERVGGTRPIRADVRVIAATNRDLQADISAGTFRSDLFYRLNVFPIEIPALRERKEDIPLLVEYFIDRYARKAGKHIKAVNKKTLRLLQSYSWPGNIRELQNVIERSVILCETEIFSIDESWLPQQPSVTEPTNQIELRTRLVTQEKNLIEGALKECRGRVFGPRGAAVMLGIPRSTLESKIRSLQIDKNRFKTSPGNG